MTDKIFTDLETFMLDVGYDRIFRMLEKRTSGNWTPRELENKCIDESCYVRDSYILIKIIEMIELPDKDILIGFKELPDLSYLGTDEYENLPIIYRKLSQLDLAFYPSDMRVQNFED